VQSENGEYLGRTGNLIGANRGKQGLATFSEMSQAPFPGKRPFELYFNHLRRLSHPA
jgi:hypothetical protein